MTTTDFEIDTTPDTSMILAQCESNLGWKKAIAELLDNAIDAGATEVVVQFGKQINDRPVTCALRDNGSGSDEVTNFFRFGGRARHASTRLGRYGIGAKEACLWIGGPASTMSVRTVRGRRCKSASANWAKLVSSKTWKFSASDTEAPIGEAGTTITIAPVLRYLPHGEKLDELLADLGYMYTGAIDAGHRILVQGLARRATVALQPYRLPPLEPGELETTIEVLGRSVHLRAGIVREGEPNRRPGLTYVHAFRVIKSACGDGLGAGSIGRIAGIVELGNDWPLTKNKDDIADGEGLYSVIASAMRPLTERAERSRMVMESAALRADLERMVNAQLGVNANPDAKAKRGSGEDTGSKEPKNTGRKHKRARSDQPGETFRKYGSIRVEFTDLGTTQRIGRFASGTVMLNTAHPMVLATRQNANKEALFLLVTIVLSHAVAYESTGKQLRLPLMSDDSDSARFHEAVATILASPMRVDGEDVHQVAAE
jgi:hypothetical protein